MHVNACKCKLLQKIIYHKHFFPTRFLQAVQNEKGEVILIGNSWSGDIDRWEDDVIRIPRKNCNLGKK